MPKIDFCFALNSRTANHLFERTYVATVADEHDRQISPTIGAYLSLSASNRNRSALYQS